MITTSILFALHHIALLYILFFSAFQKKQTQWGAYKIVAYPKPTPIEIFLCESAAAPPREGM